MTISDRDRKILWAKAGNRCSKCRSQLVQPADDSTTSHAVVGEECHIVSPRPNGPRGGGEHSGIDLDSYDNLVLLCPSDHSIVDQMIDDYPSGRLLEMKSRHEAWVSSTLEAVESAPLSIRRGKPSILVEVMTGKELLAITAGAEESSLDHDDLLTQEEVDEVGAFLQSVFDWGEIWDDLEPGARIQAEFDLGQEVTALRGHGWRVFGARGRGYLSGGITARASSWDTAYVRVVRRGSEEIVRVAPVEGLPGDEG